MQNKGFGPIWSGVVKIMSAVAPLVLIGSITWARNVEGKLAVHDVVLSAMQSDRAHLKETLDDVRRELIDVNKQLREMQQSIATLAARQK